MLKVDRVPQAAGQTEQLFKVKLLRRADDVPDRICVPLVDAVLDCRDIRRRIPKPAIGFPNDEWIVV
jgi:hypothetical protein